MTPEIKRWQASDTVQRLLWRGASYQHEEPFIKQKREEFDLAVKEFLSPRFWTSIMVPNRYVSEIVKTSDLAPIGIEGGQIGYLWVTASAKDQRYRIHFSKQDPLVYGSLTEGEVLVESSAGKDLLVCGRNAASNDIEAIFTLLKFIQQQQQKTPMNPADLMEEFLPLPIVRELLSP